MAATYDFYMQRADEAAKAAERATLDNVRERELRAEKTWRGLAQQAHAVAARRQKHEKEKELRQEART